MMKMKLKISLISICIMGVPVLINKMYDIKTAIILLLLISVIFIIENYQNTHGRLSQTSLNININRDLKKQRETYIATLSHDLRIPVLAQIRALEVLSQESLGELNPTQKEIVKDTLDSCNHMNEMLSMIVNSFKFENNNIVLYPEKVDMTEILKTCLDEFNAALENKNLKFNIKSNYNSIEIFADKIQISKAFKSLIDYCISNAFDNTEIICNIKKTNSVISISLSFKNPYKTSNKIQNMFDKYQTSSEKLDKVGAGLALYYAKQIINAHNGSIEIETKNSNLNIYNIELPCINDCKFSPAIC